MVNKEDIIIKETNSDDVQNLFLVMARGMAQERGLSISFEGRYAQGRKANPELVAYTPFVIAQDAISRNNIKEGILEGLIFELGKIAEISAGIIKPETIVFKKKYVARTHLFAEINPNPILYGGTSNDSGKEYNGRWAFNSDSASLCLSGTFQLIRTFD